MTPKEKAVELIDKMYNSDYCHGDHFPNKNYCDCSEINRYQAKQCALIALDEIFSNNTNQSKHDYWCRVKEELDKL